jgi:hypothetical protein
LRGTEQPEEKSFETSAALSAREELPDFVSPTTCVGRPVRIFEVIVVHVLNTSGSKSSK